MGEDLCTQQGAHIWESVFEPGMDDLLVDVSMTQNRMYKDSTMSSQNTCVQSRSSFPFICDDIGWEEVERFTDPISCHKLSRSIKYSSRSSNDSPSSTVVEARNMVELTGVEGVVAASTEDVRGKFDLMCEGGPRGCLRLRVSDGEVMGVVGGGGGKERS